MIKGKKSVAPSYNEIRYIQYLAKKDVLKEIYEKLTGENPPDIITLLKDLRDRNTYE